MIFAQFYQKSATSDEVIEACGDRAVIVLDGRYALATNRRIAAHWCRKRGYLGYRLHRGAAFTRSAPISDYKPVPP